jgi:hypothetical protein
MRGSGVVDICSSTASVMFSGVYSRIGVVSPAAAARAARDPCRYIAIVRMGPTIINSESRMGAYGAPVFW